ncbi:hypothetical protein [Hymenobacter baengnokdamensis]|uniref:hypothetical protein n=1 Tax=Hymenobacter baengnokdamensis TaxID=2615203 RepID=UPI0012470BDA|nr:hypothetical protein [Hymenobacter baengnokdamensis]
MLRTFTVPVKPHVQKYLLHHLGPAYKLSQLDPIGRILRLRLQAPRTNAYLDGFTGRYTAEFSVSIEGNLLFQRRFKALRSTDIIDFNNDVEAIIKTEFYGMVAHRRDFGLSQYGAIQQFRAKYNFLDEDITHDALKKAWQRYCADQLAPENVQNRVSVCPLPGQRLAA